MWIVVRKLSFVGVMAAGSFNGWGVNLSASPSPPYRDELIKDRGSVRHTKESPRIESKEMEITDPLGYMFMMRIADKRTEKLDIMEELTQDG